MTNFCYRIALVILAIEFWRCVLCKKEYKIIGGQNISISEAPHAVAIYLVAEDGSKHICGSSLLLNNVLLTAAHCGFKKLGQFGVEAGKSIVYRNIKMVNKTKMIIHQKFNESVLGYDIAIIKLHKPLIFGKNIKRIAIMKNPPRASNGTVAGWGRTQLDTSIKYKQPYYLKSTCMRIFDYEKCVKRHKTQPVGTFCVLPVKEPALHGYTFKGDSGSSLVINDIIAVGIVSYHYGSGDAKSGRIFTNISYHYDWIAKQVENLVCGEVLSDSKATEHVPTLSTFLR